MTQVEKSLEQKWSALNSNELWDLVVIGGGITGAGIFREAAKAGYKVLLVEQEDYAWGTSSRSSKMVHGGFRYIAQGDIQLTKEALKEREQMIKDAPGLVDREQFIFPMRKGRFPGRFSLTVLLTVYDLLAGVKDCDYVDNDELNNLVPNLAKGYLKGAVTYSDAITDDSRLVMRVLQEGKEFGGSAFNYCKATQVERDEDGAVNGITIHNKLLNETLLLNAKSVVNATGAWADNLMGSGADKKVRPLRGSHIMLDSSKLELNRALTLIHPDDGRPIFMFPWCGAIMIGTTDLDYPEDLNIEAAMTRVELDYLFKCLNDFFPGIFGEQDIISSFAGVRPVISSGKGVSPSKEKRGHSIWEDKGLISVSGGKLTIFRVIANEVLEKLSPLVQGEKFKTSETVLNKPAEVNNVFLEKKGISSDATFAMRLQGRYGFRLADFLNEFNGDEQISWYDEILDTGFCLADCAWAIRYEQVQFLDDLLLRRTRLGLAVRNDVEILSKLKLFALSELLWDELDWDKQVDRYKDIKRKYYSVPA